MSKLTSQNIRDLIEDELNDPLSNISNSHFLRWVNYLNRRVYNLLVELDDSQVITTETISVIEGTSTYALPSGFGVLTSRNTGLFETNSLGELTDKKRTKTNPGSSQLGYYIEGSNLILTPKPTVNETLKLRYIPALSKLSFITQETFIDDNYEEYVKDDVKSMYYEFIKNPTGESFSDQRKLRTITQMLNDYSLTSYNFNYIGNSSLYQ